MLQHKITHDLVLDQAEGAIGASGAAIHGSQFKDGYFRSKHKLDYK